MSETLKPFDRQSLSEADRVRQRHAAVFAVMTFDARYFEPTIHANLGVSFTDKQLEHARAFIKSLPTLDEVLPQPYHDSPFHDRAARAYRTWSEIISTVIPHALAQDPDSLPEPEGLTPFDHPDAGLLSYDPSGVTFVQAIFEHWQQNTGLRRMEDLPLKLQAEAEFIVADQVLRAEEENPPLLPERIDWEHDREDEVERKLNLISRVWHYQHREEYRNVEKAAVYFTTGYALDAEGNITHGTILRGYGVRHAVEQYMSAVEFYLTNG